MIKETQDKEFLKRELAWKVCRWFVDNPVMLSDTILRIVYKNARKTLINFFKDYYHGSRPPAEPWQSDEFYDSVPQLQHAHQPDLPADQCHRHGAGRRGADF